MTDKELFGLCQQYGREARKWKNKFVSLLPEVYRRQLYRKKGFGSIFEFAAKLGGVSKNVVLEVIRVEKRLEEMPKLKEKIAEVGIHKVRIVTSAATKETDEEWAEKTITMTKAALETHVKDIRRSHPGMGLPIPQQNDEFDNNYENFSAKLDPKIILKLKIIKSKMRKGATWNEVFEQLVDIPTPRPQKNPRPSNPKKRHLATAKRRELEGKCSIDGCKEPATEIHHKKPWASRKSHDELEPLCKPHHELAHQSESAIDQKFRQYKLLA